MKGGQRNRGARSEESWCYKPGIKKRKNRTTGEESGGKGSSEGKRQEGKEITGYRVEGVKGRNDGRKEVYGARREKMEGENGKP